MKSKKELLAEAKLRYPPGTIIKSPFNGLLYTVIDNDFELMYDDLRIIVSVVSHTTGEITASVTDEKGNWAEIISKPPTITKEQKQHLINLIKSI